MVLLMIMAAFAQESVFVDEGDTLLVEGPMHAVPKPAMDILLGKIIAYDKLVIKFEDYKAKSESNTARLQTALETAAVRMEVDAETIRQKDVEIIKLEQKVKASKRRANIATGVATGAILVIATGVGIALR